MSQTPLWESMPLAKLGKPSNGQKERPEPVRRGGRLSVSFITVEMPGTCAPKRWAEGGVDTRSSQQRVSSAAGVGPGDPAALCRAPACSPKSARPRGHGQENPDSRPGSQTRRPRPHLGWEGRP